LLLTIMVRFAAPSPHALATPAIFFPLFEKMG
jgi:hypothetical protein